MDKKEFKKKTEIITKDKPSTKQDNWAEYQDQLIRDRFWHDWNHQTGVFRKGGHYNS